MPTRQAIPASNMIRTAPTAKVSGAQQSRRAPLEEMVSGTSSSAAFTATKPQATGPDVGDPCVRPAPPSEQHLAKLEAVPAPTDGLIATRAGRAQRRRPPPDEPSR